MVVVTVEAPIAAGKSTLLRLIANAFPGQNVVVVPEPVAEWQDVNGAGNLLDLFYNDTKRYAYTFESYLLVSRVKALENAMAEHPGDDIVFVMERSWKSSRYVFGELTWEAGHFNKLEWELYKQTYAFVAANAPQIDGHIFLSVTPSTAMDRLKKRSRSEESSLPIEYQEGLVRQHESWLGATTVPVLRIDGDREFESDLERRDVVLSAIRGFVQTKREMCTPMRQPKRKRGVSELSSAKEPHIMEATKEATKENEGPNVTPPSKMLV